MQKYSKKIFLTIILTAVLGMGFFAFSSEAQAAPAITSPTPETTLTGSSVDFTWSANGTAVTAWYLWAGPCNNVALNGCGDDYYNSGQLGSGTLAKTATNLPTNGSPVYVRLWYQESDVWQSIVFTYTALTTTTTGTTYYVCNNKDDCNDGAAGTTWETGSDANTTDQAQSRLTPWATIQKCAYAMTPGDTCIVGDGTYNENVWLLSGSAGHYVTMATENSRGATLTKPSGNKIGFTTRTAASGAVTSYINIRGFKITGYPFGFAISVQTGSHHIGIYDNEIYHTGNGFPTIPETGLPNCEFSYGLGGIYMYGEVTNVTIDGNLIHDNGRTPPSLEDCPPARRGEIYNHDHGIYSRANGYITITNNIFYNHFVGYHIAIAWSYEVEPVYVIAPHHVVISNNTFHGTNHGGIESDVNGIGFGGRTGANYVLVENRPHDNLIQNNIFYNTRAEANDKIFSICGWCDTAMTIRNNIVYGAADGDPMDITNLFVDNDEFDVPDGFAATANTIYYADPQFNDVGGEGAVEPRDYTLATGSPAINTGYATNAPDHDYLGTTRPQGAYDIGAYEYPEVTSNPTDVNSDGRVNIKDIQICVKGIVDQNSIPGEQLAKCRAVALPDTVVNIKDIQEVIRKIINPS